MSGQPPHPVAGPGSGRPQERDAISAVATIARDGNARFADLAALLARAHDLPTLSERMVEAIATLTGLPAAALYLPGTERLRMQRTAQLDADGSASAPRAIRIDGGFAADVLAGERVLTARGTDRTAIDGLRAGTVVAVPVRDGRGRPLALLLAFSEGERDLPPSATVHAAQLASLAAGLLEGVLTQERSSAALASLPEIATIGLHEDDPEASLDLCVEVAAEATQSDAAVLRLADSGPEALRVAAAYSRLGDAVGDVIGMLSSNAQVLGRVGDDHQPPAEADPVAITLAARSVRSYDVGPAEAPFGVLQLLRRSARPFDAADDACARIVAAQAARIVELAQSAQTSGRAIGAARSALGLLGDALVAGVRTERTLRFVPRLLNDMFAAAGVRVWRVERDGRAAIVAGSGRIDGEDRSLLDAAGAAPLTLRMADQRRESDPIRVAVAVTELSGDRIVCEVEFAAGRTLTGDEQAPHGGLTERVSEAMWSADQALAQQRQLDRVRGLQLVIATAHETLSEGMIAATVLPALASQYDADGCALLLSAEDGRLRVQSAQSIPGPVVAAWGHARHWLPDADGDERGSVVMAAGLGSDVRLGELRSAFAGSDLADASAVFVPLAAREQTLGCLVLTFAGRLPVAIDREVAMLGAFGLHVGSAILNARDHERERQARQRLERILEIERENSRQVRALHEVARTFAASLSLDETMRAVVEAMANRLDVDAVWIRTPDDRGDRMLLRAFYASHPELSGALERMVSPPMFRADPIFADVLTSRQPLLIDGADVDRSVYASSDVIERLRPFLHRGSSLAILPVATPNEVIGVLTMLSIDPEHALTREKIEIAANVTSQAALSLDNARLYQQQKHFADVIQESLLPSRLPQIPEIDLGVLYRSATGGGAEVGGDFYDFMELDDGRLALVLGDVTGKGVAAAADTAMTKYIFRALAREHPSPAGFLSYANKVVCEEITPGKFVTLFYAVIDPKRNVLVCGNAGHPEPKLVIRTPGVEEPELMSLGMEGLALGILPDQDYEQREYPFAPGTSLVVYTDGVVEARRNHRLYGQYRLERRLLDEGDASAPQIAFAVYQDCAAYAEDGLGDDVAIVVAQRVIPHEDAVAGQ